MDLSPRRADVGLGADYEGLLRVALLPGDQTHRAWRDLEPRLNQAVFDDSRAVRIMPLVARALVSAGIEAPTRDRMKGTARHNFAGNQMLLADAGRALAALAERDVSGIALAGVPIVLGYYDDVSLRPLVNFDLLVPPSRVSDATAALHAAGWQCNPVGQDLLRRKSLLWFHAPDRHAPVALHWRLVPWVDRRGSGQDPELWRRARPLEVSGQATLALCPEDLLLHIVLRAFARGWHDAPEWVLDATMVVQRTPELDWDHFTRRAVEGHVTAPLGDALTYAADLVGLGVPDDVLTALATARLSRSEHRRYQHASRTISGRRQAVVGQLDDLRTLWSRRHLNLTAAARLRAATPFVLDATNANHLAAVPLVVARHRAAAVARRRPVSNGHYART